MTDKPRDLGDYQSALDAYVAAGYSKEGAEAVLDQHCAIVASHKPPAPPPQAVAEPVADAKPDVKPKQEPKQELPAAKLDAVDKTEDAKEKEPA